MFKPSNITPAGKSAAVTVKGTDVKDGGYVQNLEELEFRYNDTNLQVEFVVSNGKLTINPIEATEDMITMHNPEYNGQSQLPTYDIVSDLGEVTFDDYSPSITAQKDVNADGSYPATFVFNGNYTGTIETE